MPAHDAVTNFWFQTPNPDGTIPEATSRRWFRKDDAFDQELRDRFAALHAQALAGELDAWAQTPEGRVALVIVLDQFSRNMFRNSPRAFAGDEKALALALEGLSRGEHRELPHPAVHFLLMPLMHAEDLKAQDRGIELWQELARTAPPEFRSGYADGAKYAQMHRDIIARFGRFPHRNAALGREATAEEAEFLKQPNSSF